MEGKRNDPANDHPRLLVIAEGGTILSRVFIEGDTKRPIIKPTADTLQELFGRIPQWEADAFEWIHPYEGELIDSAKATAERNIRHVVRNLRTLIAQDMFDIAIMCAGTDTMADLVSAMGNGISKEELAEKAVIVTGSMQHMEEKHSDAVRNFQHSVSLALTNGVRGKIGLCINDRFFPPRGIEKVQLTREHPFVCRYRRMAKYEEHWDFDRPSKPFDEPRGEKDREFLLTQGIEEVVLTTTSDYNLLVHKVEGNKATVLVAPGNGNLRTDEESLAALRRAEMQASGVIAVVGAAIQNAEDTLPFSEDWEDAVYEGDSSFQSSSKLISAGAMTPTEIRMLLSQWVAEAEADGVDADMYVKTKMQEYPFKDAASSRWREMSAE